MTGAMALKSDQLSGRLMLNLDSETDDEITVGCAGGVDIKIEGRLETEEIVSSNLFHLQITKLIGGHSGVDIHKNFANAILIFTECVDFISQELSIRICSIEGGQLTNVIPNFCTGIVTIPNGAEAQLQNLMMEFERICKKKYSTTDPDLSLRIERVKGESRCLDSEDQKNFLGSIESLPNGVIAWSKEEEGMVRTSNSLATIKLENGEFIMQTHARSFVDQERDAVLEEIKKAFDFANVEGVGSYPGWEPKFDSALLNTGKRVYQELFRSEPAIIAIHAGLECGIFAEIIPEMEMISIGPNTLGAHSPDERVQISSVQKT